MKPHRRRDWVISLMWILIMNTGPVQAQRPLNLDFERQSVADPDMPWGWSLGWSAFTAGPAATFSLDKMVRHGGRSSLRIAMSDSSTDAPPQSIMLQLSAAFFLGREVRLGGWMRTAGPTTSALVTLEAWKDRELATADTAEVASAAGDGEPKWTRYQLTIRVPSDPRVHSVVITATLLGSGATWFDDFTLEVQETPIATLPVSAAPPSETELTWLARHATPLRGLRYARGAVANDSDLGRFADIVGDARIVALGESTHGTREFFLVKHRLLEYLVREAGFTVFAIEANQLAVERINLYVQGGAGTARDVMRVMFRVWNTEAMLALVEWMREHNAAHPERMLRFAGYDMQDHKTPADTLRAFLERTEPNLVPRFDELVGEYRAQSSSATPHIPDTTRARWHRQAEELWSTVNERRTAWLARAANGVDSSSVEWAVQASNLLRQSARFNVALSSPERDSLMAANLDWMLRTHAPGARALVWAHDVHVSRGGDPELSFNGGAQMGAYLSHIYGDDYRAFSLLTYDGAYSATRSFTDHRMIEAEAYPAPTGSIEAALHAIPRPPQTAGLVVDLRRARAESSGDWLNRARPIRHIGYAAYDYGFEFEAVLSLEFDGLVFIDHTTPSRLLQ